MQQDAKWNAFIAHLYRLQQHYFVPSAVESLALVEMIALQQQQLQQVQASSILPRSSGPQQFRGAIMDPTPMRQITTYSRTCPIRKTISALDQSVTSTSIAPWQEIRSSSNNYSLVSSDIADVTATSALRLAVRARDGDLAAFGWHRTRGRPLTTWLHQICSDCELKPSAAIECAEDRSISVGDNILKLMFQLCTAF